MKNLRLIIAAAFLMIGFTTNATIRDSASIMHQNTGVKIDLSKNLSYPELAKTNLVEGTVAASITTLGDGRLKVLAINGHPMLISSVQKQIESLQLTKNGFIPGQAFCVKINFEIE